MSLLWTVWWEMRDEKTVTTAESGQCVVIMDSVVGDEK